MIRKRSSFIFDRVRHRPLLLLLLPRAARSREIFMRRNYEPTLRKINTSSFGCCGIISGSSLLFEVINGLTTYSWSSILINGRVGRPHWLFSGPIFHVSARVDLIIETKVAGQWITHGSWVFFFFFFFLGNA